MLRGLGYLVLALGLVMAPLMATTLPFAAGASASVTDHGGKLSATSAGSTAGIHAMHGADPTGGTEIPTDQSYPSCCSAFACMALVLMTGATPVLPDSSAALADWRANGREAVAAAPNPPPPRI